MPQKHLCKCGNEIPEARQRAMASIGGTNCCVSCQKKAEETEKAERKYPGKHLLLRPNVARRAQELLANRAY